MPLLSVFPVILLAFVAGWFVWPMIADPIARRRARMQVSDADRQAEQLFAAWAKYGQGTPQLIRAERH